MTLDQTECTYLLDTAREEVEWSLLCGFGIYCNTFLSSLARQERCPFVRPWFVETIPITYEINSRKRIPVVYEMELRFALIFRLFLKISAARVWKCIYNKFKFQFGFVWRYACAARIIYSGVCVCVYVYVYLYISR